MNIAIITSVLGSAGGMGRVVEEHAFRLAKRGHRVTVFVPGKRLKVKGQKSKVNDDTKIEGVTVIAVRPRFRYGHGAWIPQIGSLLRGFDVVHAHYPFLGGVGAIIRWRKKTPGARLVITYHMDLVGRGLFRPIFRLYQKLFMPSLLRAADRIMVSSLDYAAAGDMKKMMGTIKNKLDEIPFGIDLDRFAPRAADSTLLAQLQIAPDQSVVLFVGGLDSAHYFKGVDILLKAFSELVSESRNVRLVIVGRGNRLQYFKQLAQKLKIASHAIFASDVSVAQLPSYYNLADVFVLPSVDRSEAFGLVLLEAQASGVPVISSNIVGVRTVLAEHETGLLIPPRDSHALAQALSRMLSNSDERERMARTARVRAETYYRWDVIIDRLEDVYRSVM